MMKAKKVLLLICVAALLLCIFPVCAGAEEAVETVTVYSGETAIAAAWTMGPAVYTDLAGGSFDPDVIREGGCFAVYYSGTRAQVYLALQDAASWNWCSANTPTSTESTDTGYVSYFSFADCAAAYGSSDFSNLGAVIVGSTQSTEEIVVTGIQWTAMPEEEIPERQLVQNVLFSGSRTISGTWTFGPMIYTINAEGDFNPSLITADGYFSVTYTGTEGAVYISFSKSTSGIWPKVKTPAETTVNGDGSYTSIFTFADCADVYGSENFLDLQAVCVGSGESVGDTVITEVSWYGYPTFIELNETALLFEGNVTAASQGTNLTFFYFKHVGGQWDASQINEGSYFYVEYTGAKDGIYLAFASASGATNWAAVYPDETGVDAAGNYYSLYSYDNFAKAFGTNFTRLDQIQVYCAKNEEVTLKRIAYFAGEGDPVDTGDGTWDRADTGIAFIGDSIVQNPLVDYSHLGSIDWNGILGRTDCSNYGIGGQTTRECVARIDELAKKNYDKVVMLCGINDIGRGYTNTEITENYTTMIQALKESNPRIQVYIVSVLPTTPAFYTGMQHKIVELNTDLAALADSLENVTFVDCHSSFVGDDGYCKEGITFDGLHPNLDGYAIIAQILNPYLDEPLPEIVETEPEATETTVPEQNQNSEPAEEPSNHTGLILCVVLVAVAGVVAVVIVRKRKK